MINYSKSSILIILYNTIFIFYSNLLSAQNVKYISLNKSMGIMNDTMQCFQESIIAHKDIYLHKPLKYLLSDLVIPVKSYSTEVTVRPSDAITSIDFYFIHWNEVMNNVFFSKLNFAQINF